MIYKNDGHPNHTHPYGDCTMTSSPSSSFVLPSLIQRCVVSGELLGYEYMEPSFCFAAGHQREAIKKLVEQGFALYETKVTVNKNTGPSRTVYVIAPLSFDLDAYHKHLVAMARGELRVEAPTGFDSAMNGQGVTTEVWFDITPSSDGDGKSMRNAVLWTLSQKKMSELNISLLRLGQRH